MKIQIVHKTKTNQSTKKLILDIILKLESTNNKIQLYDLLNFNLKQLLLEK